MSPISSKLKELRIYIVNASFLVFENIFSILLNLLVGFWVARYLGPSDFGILNYANSIIFMLIPLASFGLDSLVARELSLHKEQENVNKILGTAFFLKLAGSILIYIVLFSITQMEE